MFNGSMIIEKIENDNGTAIKFEDGTMICYGKRTFTVTNNNHLGQLYYGGSLNLGKYPETFIEEPVTNLTIKGNMAVAEYAYGGVSSIGSIYVFNATSRTNQTEIVNFIAFGKWK